jgi:hypothetical protein
MNFCQTFGQNLFCTMARRPTSESWLPEPACTCHKPRWSQKKALGRTLRIISISRELEVRYIEKK